MFRNLTVSDLARTNPDLAATAYERDANRSGSVDEEEFATFSHPDKAQYLAIMASAPVQPPIPPVPTSTDTDSFEVGTIMVGLVERNISVIAARYPELSVQVQTEKMAFFGPYQFTVIATGPQNKIDDFFNHVGSFRQSLADSSW